MTSLIQTNPGVFDTLASRTSLDVTDPDDTRMPALFMTSLIQTDPDVFDTFASHARLVYDITDTECLEQNGSA